MAKKKILIVDDERIIAEDIKQTLIRLGYEVTGIASSGKEALEKAKANIPDLVIMDFVLRGKMDGITAAEHMKNLFDIPSIYLTAYADDTILKRAKISAPFSYIMKPFEERELYTNIEIALERSMTERLFKRMNTVLKTVRDINQLIVRERDRRKLIKKACKILTGDRGYLRAWIVLLDKNRKLTDSAQSGWGKPFQRLVKMIKKGDFPECSERALTSTGIVINRGTARCYNCPFQDSYPEYPNLTFALMSHGKTYGLISVALPENVSIKKEETDLFLELAGDITFGLHDIELEERHRQLERTLQLIVEGTSAATGEEFFKKLVRSIAQTMNMEIVFISRRDSLDPQSVQSIAMWMKDQIADNMKWEVGGTPCRRVINGETVVVTQGVQKAFPQDVWLQDVNAESYLAVPIFDSDGNVAGHLGTLDSRSLENPRHLDDILKIFAVRAGAELQRLQAEEELESVFKSNPLPIMTLDKDLAVRRYNNAAMEYCNINASDMTGLRPGEVLLCIHHLDDPRGCGYGHDCINCIAYNTIMSTFRDRKPRQGIESEMLLVLNDQPYQRTIRLNTSYFDTLLGPMVMIIFDDITEQKKIQNEILRLKDFNESVLTGMAEGIVVMDAEGIIEYVNPAAIGLLGYTENELINQHWSLIIPKDQNSVMKAAGEIRKKGESSVYELQLVHKKGGRIFVRVSGSPRFKDGEFIGTMAVVTDITEQNKTIKALEESEEKFRSIFESFIDVYYRQNKDKRVTMVSPSVRQFGYEPEDVIGTRAMDYYTDKADWESFVAHLNKEGIVKDYQVKLKDAGGMPVWVSMNMRILRDADGNFDGIDGVIRDIRERKSAEEKRRRTQENLNNLFRYTTDAIIIQDRNYVILDCNTAAEKLFGYTKDELTANPDIQLEVAEKIDENLKTEYLNRVMQGHPQRFEWWGKRKDGTTFPEEMLLNKTVFNGEEVVFITIRDITERKQAAEAVEESEMKYRKLVENSVLGMALYFPNEGYFLSNLQLSEITGYSADEIQSPDFDFSELFSEEDAKIINENTKKRLSGSEIPVYTLPLKTKNNEIKYVEIHNVLINFKGKSAVQIQLMDVTEREQAENALRKSEEKFKKAFKTSPDSINLNRLSDGLYLETNRGFESITGYTAEEVIGKTSLELNIWKNPEDREKLVKGLTEKGYVENLEAEFMIKNGDIKIGLMSAILIEIDGVEAILSITRDITQRKELENELKVYRQHLEEIVEARTVELKAANKELESFAYSVSHDLRTPLRAIDGFSGFLLEEYSDKLDDEGIRLLNIVRENTVKMDRLISDLLNLSRQTRAELNKEKINMNKMVHRVFDEIATEDEKKKFNFIVNDIPDAVGDYTAVKQIWSNLIGNSLKYSVNSNVKKIIIGSLDDDQTRVYYIKDNGSGFDMKYKDKLFGVFQRLHKDEEFEGSGVGLAIVKRLINRHGGKIWAESRVNEGAAFYFSLPE